jgi:serine phosphatase RsbU (regulator of sigma subunit)
VASPGLTIGSASCIYPGETVNGDAWRVDWHEGVCRVALIDGLGHGPAAAHAAEAALRVLAERPALGPAEALRACHGALGGTRGAAISVASIDAAGSLLVFAGVGNVDGHLYQDSNQVRLVAYRGIIGAVMPLVRAVPYELQSGWLLVMHTDGVRARFRLEDVPAEMRADPQQLADGIMADWRRTTDDATIVVLQGAAG